MSKKLLRIVIMGAPATGKGTISKRMVAKYNFVHISSGDLLRLNILHKTPVGQQADAYMSQGLLVPDDLVIGCVMNSITKEAKEETSLILDGFPRTLAQAKFLHASNITLDAIFNLNVPDEIIIERLQNRWMHLPSGRIYHKDFNKRRILWKDDATGEDLVQRADAKPEVALKRLQVHHDTVRPIFEFYKQNNVDILDLKFNSIEDIWSRVVKYLEVRIQMKDYIS